MTRRGLAVLVLLCATVSTRAGQAQVTNSTVDATDPAVVALVNASDQLRCTATVIAPHTLITAAHCIESGDPRTLRAFVGTTIPEGMFLAIADARLHPGFDPGGRDIAVITVRDEAPVSPIEIEPATLDASYIGTQIRVVGFGLTRPGGGDSGTKRVGTAGIASVQAEELVAVPDPSLSCLGDSGGPALLPAGTIAGVVSRGDAMCVDHAVYTRIDAARGILVDPYLAETAPGTAAIGDACLYAEQCGAGTCTASESDPLAYVCTDDAGCAGCASAAPAHAALIVLLFGLRARRRSRPITRA